MVSRLLVSQSKTLDDHQAGSWYGDNKRHYLCINKTFRPCLFLEIYFTGKHFLYFPMFDKHKKKLIKGI